MITNLAHAQEALSIYYARSRQQLGDDSALNRMEPLLRAVGNPHERLRVMHVAGTSGKTSTCYYIASLLHASHKKVGLTVSPYIDSILERVQIDGRPITERDFCERLSSFLDLISAVSPQPGYFEVLVAFALWHFDSAQVDYVVLETGIGGLFDSTNVIMRADKVCVITDIGMDHMKVLGDSIPAIAAQKAGIIQQHNDVFMYEQGPDVMGAMHTRIDALRARLHLVLQGEVVRESHLPLFQQRNWQLARSVCEFVAERDGFSVASSIDANDIIVPGRMEIKRSKNGQTVVFDGAHNAQKMQAFVSSFQARFPGEVADILVAFKDDKEYVKALEYLRPITRHLYVTSTLDTRNSTARAYPVTSANTSEVYKAAVSLGFDAEIVEEPHRAIEQLLRDSEGIKVVTGSFYLLGIVRAEKGLYA